MAKPNDDDTDFTCVRRVVWKASAPLTSELFGAATEMVAPRTGALPISAFPTVMPGYGPSERRSSRQFPRHLGERRPRETPQDFKRRVFENLQRREDRPTVVIFWTHKCQ